MVLDFSRDIEPNARSVPLEFFVGQHHVRPALNRIRTPTDTFQVEPKIMQVLVRLVEAEGQVVSRDEILHDVWEDAYVTDDVLTRSIGELRRIFGDDPSRPAIIETIRKRGYRLIAPVEVVAKPQNKAEAGEPRIRTSREADTPAWRWVVPGAAVVLGAVAVAAVLGSRFLGHGSSDSSRSRRVIPLTSFSGNEVDPALSPDGSRVAFVWDGGDGEEVDLYVKLTTSETPLRLTASLGRERAPVWSPDGSRLAFARLQGGECTIFTVPAIGGPERRLAPCGDVRAVAMAWSPDGQWLVLSRPAEGQERYPVRLQLLSVETLERRDLTRPSEQFLGDHTPAFSPDGKRVAFIRSRSGNAEDIWLVPVAEGEARQLTFENRHVSGLDFSSDGREILFSSDRAGTYSLWKIPVSGGQPVWIAGGGSKMADPSAARQGRFVTYENWIYEANIWRLPLRGPDQEPQPIIASTLQWDFEPAVSPSGDRIAFASTRSGNHEIWVADRDGGEPVQITYFTGAYSSRPRWSPDGRDLVFEAMPEGQADLYRVEASGGVPARLTSHPLDEKAPSWSADGRWVYFGSRRSGRWQVWKVAAEGGQVAQVTWNGGYAAIEGPDGRWLYFSKADAPGLWRQRTDKGAEEMVVEVLDPEDRANWARGYDGLYFPDRSDPEEPALAYLAFGVSEPARLARLDPRAWDGLTVSPDGEWLLYARTDRRESNILMVENY